VADLLFDTSENGELSQDCRWKEELKQNGHGYGGFLSGREDC
jgi:hypothetical protein